MAEIGPSKEKVVRGEGSLQYFHQVFLPFPSKFHIELI